MTPAAAHPFARFVRILGRGKTLTRSLTIEEAEEAMGMILAGEVRPEQLGAFLMLLRVKEETGEEIAGFIRAARAALARPGEAPRVDLDWPSYAGKKRQAPWHLLAALVVARSGWSVFMHGLDGLTEGRVYSGETLRRLGFPSATNFDEAAAHIARRRFAYMPIERISPRLADMMALKSILGLRSPIHTLARGLNPIGAGATLNGDRLARAARAGVPWRWRRERAAAGQAVRDDADRGRAQRGDALAAASRHSAGPRRGDRSRPAGGGMARR
jgi:anthranilate phosphoribosyltransferase